MKSLLDVGRFITKRNFWNVNKHLQKRKLTITLSTLSVVQQIPQETKQKDNISRSNSNNRSQAQEFNIPDVLVKRPSRNNHI